MNMNDEYDYERNNIRFIKWNERTMNMNDEYDYERNNIRFIKRMSRITQVKA